ncbi:MAG TPA: FKBP-type peptidyl-prolyl cis-trans isomerase [Ignavibacteriaceae bacterium]|nr:FKBP-type peptidyl-prolyl cis-trans isomerase [Ignavibacteriaceae bacterium]
MRFIVLFAALSFGLVSCQTVTKDDLKTQDQKVSYSIGINIGKNIKTDGLNLDLELFMQGIKDAMEKDSNFVLTEEEMQAVFAQLQQDMAAKQMKKLEEQAAPNKKAGAEFLAKNKTTSGVVATASGLQYKVISSGNGPSPKATDKVRVHYEGRLLDGTIFDSSVKRGEPAEFPLNGVIKGWTEALQLMKVGDKWEIYIPSDLAYGDQGSQGVIPPGAMLIFSVELLGIVK